VGDYATRLDAGCFVHEAGIRLMIVAIDDLMKRARASGAVPSAALVNLRNELNVGLVHSQPRGTTDEVLTADDVLEVDAAGVVDTGVAAKRLGTSDGNVRYLRRRGRLIGEFRNGRWWITSSSLDEYLQERARKRARAVSPCSRRR
jgi:hypothetical protein